MNKSSFSSRASLAAMAIARQRPAGLQTRDASDAPTIEQAVKAVTELNKAFAEFRDTNDKRVGEIEKRGSADVLIEEKTKRINDAIGSLDGTVKDLAKRLDDANKAREELELRVKRPGAPAEDPMADPAYRSEFHTFLKRGDVERGGLLEKRAMSTQDNTEGGYLTNIEVDRELARLQRDMSVARQEFTVRQIGAGAWKKPISKSNANSGWVGETDGRPQTDPSDIAEVNIPTHELYANVGATQTILDDAYVNIEQFIAEETAAAFEDSEGAAFFTGNGVSKPRGLLTLTTHDEAPGSRAAHGQLGVVVTGSTSTFGSYADKFMDTIGYLRGRYRQNAKWCFNALTEAAIRKIKDGDNNYLWQPATSLEVPSTLLGYGTVVADHMPDIGNGNLPVLFGDLRRAYTIVDRFGMRTLRDPYTLKPYVLFYVTKRVGGGPVITEAVKAMETSAA